MCHDLTTEKNVSPFGYTPVCILGEVLLMYMINKND